MIVPVRNLQGKKIFRELFINYVTHRGEREAGVASMLRRGKRGRVYKCYKEEGRNKKPSEIVQHKL
jgi:hypothetical protein